jgi:DHA1 family bicyclomycin/chloramphenicol resistance-like MFS transporter
MLGAVLSQQLSRRMDAGQLLRIGWMLIGAACVFALAESGFLRSGLPWTVLPPGLIGIGAGLAQPTLTLMVLDRFPNRRGTAASLQAAISLGTNALVSGVIAIYVGSGPLPVSIAASLLAGTGFLCWWLQDRLPQNGRPAEPAPVMRIESAVEPEKSPS